MSRHDFDFELDGLSASSASSPEQQPRASRMTRRPRSASEILKGVRASTATTDRSPQQDDENGFEAAIKRVASALSERDKYESSSKSSPASEYDEDFEEEDDDLPSSLEKDFHGWYDAAQKSSARDGLSSQDLWAVFDNDAALRSSLNLKSTVSSSRVHLERLWKEQVGSNEDDCFISRDAFISGLRLSLVGLHQQSTDFWMNDETHIGQAPILPTKPPSFSPPSKYNNKSATLNEELPRTKLASLDEDKTFTLDSTRTEEKSSPQSFGSSFEDDYASSSCSPPAVPPEPNATTTSLSSPPETHDTEKDEKVTVAVSIPAPKVARREVAVQTVDHHQSTHPQHQPLPFPPPQPPSAEAKAASPAPVPPVPPPPSPPQAAPAATVPLTHEGNTAVPALTAAAASAGNNPDVQRIIQLAAAALSGANQLISETAGSEDDDDELKSLAQHLALQCLTRPRCARVRLMRSSSAVRKERKAAACKPRVEEVSDEESRYERVVARKTMRKDFTVPPPKKKMAWWEAAALESVATSPKSRNRKRPHYSRVVSCSSSSSSSSGRENEFMKRGSSSSRRKQKIEKKMARSNNDNFAFQSQFVEVVSHFSKTSRSENDDGDVSENELRMRTAIAESLRERLTSKDTLDEIRSDVFRKLRR